MSAPNPSSASSSLAAVHPVGWSSLRSAMDWLFVAATAGMVGGILLILGSLVLGLMPVEANAQWYAAIGMILAGIPLLMLSVLAGLIGKVLCCTAPAETRAAPLAWGSTLCLVLALFLAASAVQSTAARIYGQNSFEARAGLSDRLFVAMLQSMSFSLAGVQLFVAVAGLLEVCFLRTIAVYLRNEALVRVATNYLIYQVAMPIITYALVLATIGLMMFVGKPSRIQPLDLSFWTVFFSQLTVGALAVISCLWYFRVAQMSRSCVRDFLLMQPR